MRNVEPLINKGSKKVVTVFCNVLGTTRAKLNINFLQIENSQRIYSERMIHLFKSKHVENLSVLSQYYRVSRQFSG